MKKQIVTLILMLAAVQCNAQPQWKFHVAYEDATGAKDTIWFIWDTTATFYGIDTSLGEGNPNMDYSVFNVWTITWGIYPDFDTTKVVAHPYDRSFGSEVKAINFDLPITISWDSALLHANWLPPQPVGWVNHARIYNDYFFLYPNDELIHHFDMTLDDHVIAPEPENEDPWAWQEWVHFPMSVVLRQDPTVGIGNKKDNEKISLVVRPNPFLHETTFEINIKEKSNIEISVYNLQGKLVKNLTNKTMKGGKHKIKWDGINKASRACKPGVYLIHLKINGQLIATHKIVKQ